MKKTNKKVKRVLALFLAMMMCLSMLNLTAFAEEGEGTAQPGESQAQVEASTTPVDTSTQPEVQPEETTPNTDAGTNEPAGDEVEADSQPADSNTQDSAGDEVKADSQPADGSAQDPAGDAQTGAPGADGVTTPDDQSAGSGDTGDSETGNQPAGGQDAGNTGSSGNGEGTDNEKPDEHEHVWENGACTLEGCSKTCEHAEYDPATGKCRICDVVCEHSYNAEEPDGKCAVCGFECPHEKHDPETAKCEVCGFVCEHEYDEETARCKVCDALNPEATDVSVKTVEEFTSALKEPNYQVIKLEGDIQLSGTHTINRSVTIQGPGTLTVDNLTVNNAAVVSLENVTVTDWLKVGYTGATLTVGSSVHANKMMAYEGGTLIMNEGAGTTRVSVQNSSSFIMNGGRITAENGTCVYLVSGSTFTMNAGEINGSGSKTGVEVYSDCTFRMNDGTISNANKGVYTDAGTFQMTGGTIRECSAVDGAGVYAMGGTVNISGGSITGNTAEYYGGGIFAENAAVIISGGSITGNTAGDYGGGIYAYDGTVTVSGGTISGNTVTGSNGGGIYAEDATVIISGGSITGNTAKSYGGGICAYNGTVTVNGGTISGNTATKGGGIFLNRGSLAVSGDSISNNTTELYGGGIYAQYGSLTVSGGSISNNTAKYGGGICYYDTTTNISGGSITGNKAGTAGDGGGVYHWGTGSTLSLSGDVTIIGNTKNGGANNVHLRNGQIINIAGAMGSNANVGFTVYTSAAGTQFVKGSGYTLTDADAKKFVLDTANTGLTSTLGKENDLVLEIVVETPEASYEKDGEVKTVSLQTALNEAPAGSKVTLVLDVTASTDINIPHDVTLDLAGHTLNLSGHHIVVPTGTTFTLDCPNGGTITGGGNASVTGGAVDVRGGTFYMYSGTLQGNTAMYGGAVYVDRGSKFYMYGGTIDGNTASNGGGIFVQLNAEAHVTAGAITNNTATCEVENDPNLYPYGGGGIYVNGGKRDGAENGKLYLENVAVTDNTAGEDVPEEKEKKYYAGAGLSACPTSNTKIYITSGGIIAGNMPGKDGKPISQVFVDKGNQSDEHDIFLSKYALGGGVYNWTDKDGNPLDDAGQMLNLVSNPDGVNAFSDLNVNLDVLKGIVGVVISGNTSKYSGGGIGSNGDVIIGTDKAILPIRKVVSGKTDKTEFKFDVTMTLGDEPYTGRVVVNGTNVNTNGSFTLTLKAGETQVLTDMDEGVHYVITEQDSGASSVTVNGATGNTIKGETKKESKGVEEIVFTNTYEESAPTPPPTNPPVVVTRNLTVNKVWVGDEEAEDARPDSIQVQLYRNGAAYGSPVTLNAANSWSHTWIGLSTVGNFTVEELNVPDGYIASTEISGSTVTITNTFEEEEIDDPETPLGTPKPEATPTPTPVPVSTPTPTPTPEPDDEPIDDSDVPLGPAPTPEPDDEPIDDPDVPLGPAPEEPTSTPAPTTKPTPVPEEEIPDSDVPLASTPKTGDDTNVWFLLTVISAAGLVFLGASEWKKRKGDHKA